MRKIITAVFAVLMLVATTMGFVAFTSGSASAHTKHVSATCDTLSVQLRAYAASVAGKPAVDQWWHWNGGLSWDHPFPDSRWGKDNGEHNGFPDIINEAFKRGHGLNASWFYHEVKAAVPGKTNHVKVIVDGVIKYDEDFSTTWIKDIPLGDKYVAHTYSVVVTAWDHQRYSFTENGTTVPCERPTEEPTPTDPPTSEPPVTQPPVTEPPVVTTPPTTVVPPTKGEPKPLLARFRVRTVKNCEFPLTEVYMGWTKNIDHYKIKRVSKWRYKVIAWAKDGAEFKDGSTVRTVKKSVRLKNQNKCDRNGTS